MFRNNRIVALKDVNELSEDTLLPASKEMNIHFNPQNLASFIFVKK